MCNGCVLSPHRLLQYITTKWGNYNKLKENEMLRDKKFSKLYITPKSKIYPKFFPFFLIYTNWPCPHQRKKSVCF